MEFAMGFAHPDGRKMWIAVDVDDPDRQFTEITYAADGSVDSDESGVYADLDALVVRARKDGWVPAVLPRHGRPVPTAAEIA